MDMLGGLTASEFLRDYWQKKPLVIRQAFPGFQCPVSPDELAGLACEEAVESRIVIENDAGKPWQLHNGPFNPDRFSDLPEDRKSTRLNSSHVRISYAVFCLKK